MPIRGSDTVYRGEPGGHVTVARQGHKRRPLDPRLDLRNHSPTGFAWGYTGSGPSQLALALLADALGDDDHALRLYMDFKNRTIAGLSWRKPWVLRADEVIAIALELEAAGRRRHRRAIHYLATDPDIDP